MKKHLKKVALAVALVIALTGIVVVCGSGDPEDPPGIIMVHTLK